MRNGKEKHAKAESSMLLISLYQQMTGRLGMSEREAPVP